MDDAISTPYCQSQQPTDLLALLAGIQRPTSNTWQGSPMSLDPELWLSLPGKRVVIFSKVYFPEMEHV